MHDRLLSGVRGGEADPGELRTTQNFIGSTPYIQDARYVPPPPNEIPDLLEDLLEYANQDTDLHPLLRIGLIHYQFETIHPFLDGNGRLGRLLISLLLQRDGLLPEPYLYLSSYFNARRSEYVDQLLAVSQRGDWEEWLLFFLRGVQSQADEAHQRANLVVDLREDYQQRYQSEWSENILELVMRLFEDPYLDVNTAADWLDVEYSTANRLVTQLEDDGILEELTGKERNRFYRALSAVDRRRCLWYLLEQSDASDVRELATVLAGWEASDTGSMSTESDYDAVLLELHHRHLPVLDDAGIIEYDADNGAVTLEDFDDSARYQLADLVAPGDARDG